MEWSGVEGVRAPGHPQHQLAVALMDLALTYVPAMYHLVNGRMAASRPRSRLRPRPGPGRLPLHLSNFFLIGVLGWQTGKLANGNSRLGGLLHVWQRHNFE